MTVRIVGFQHIKASTCWIIVMKHILNASTFVCRLMRQWSSGIDSRYYMLNPVLFCPMIQKRVLFVCVCQPPRDVSKYQIWQQRVRLRCKHGHKQSMSQQKCRKQIHLATLSQKTSFSSKIHNNFFFFYQNIVYRCLFPGPASFWPPSAQLSLALISAGFSAVWNLRCWLLDLFTNLVWCLVFWAY